MLSRLKFIALLGLIAGPGLAFVGWKEKQKLATIEKDGVSVPGEIESGEVTQRKRSKTYKLTVGYKPQGASEVIHKEFKVKKAYVDQHVTDNAIQDSHAEVRYLPSDPQQAVLVGGSADDTGMLPVGGAWGLLGLLTGAFMVFRKKSPASGELPPPPPAA